MLLRDAAADDEQGRREQELERRVVASAAASPTAPSRGPCAPSPRTTRATRRPCRRSRCDRARCSGSACRCRGTPCRCPVPSVVRMTRPRRALRGAEVHLGDARRIRVVDEEDVALQGRSRTASRPRGRSTSSRRSRPTWCVPSMHDRGEADADRQAVGASTPKPSIISTTTATMSSGSPPSGVATFTRSLTSSPVSTSTTAPLMPVPPMSMPIARVVMRPSSPTAG